MQCFNIGEKSGPSNARIKMGQNIAQIRLNLEWSAFGDVIIQVNHSKLTDRWLKQKWTTHFWHG